MVGGPITRRGTARASVEVKAARAAGILDDPRFKEIINDAHAQLVKDIEHVQLDGSEAAERKALEAVRMLHALNFVTRVALRPLVAEQMNKAQEHLKKERG